MRVCIKICPAGDITVDLERFKYWLFVDRIPVTKLLILANAVTFVGLYLFKAVSLLAYGAFVTSVAGARPWTAVTYPLIGDYGGGVNGFISLLFAGYWLWVAGGSLERTWGSGRFALYLAQVSVITAIGVYVGALVTGNPVVFLAGIWLPLAGVPVAFAMRNPETVVLFMIILPLKLKYLALISAAIVLISYGPFLGLFALAGCAFSYWYVRAERQYGGPIWERSRGTVIRVHERDSLIDRLNPIKWYRRYKGRRRLRKLFEDSDLNRDDHR